MINKKKIDKILSDALKSSKQGKFSKLTKEEIYFFKKSYGKLQKIAVKPLALAMGI